MAIFIHKLIAIPGAWVVKRNAQVYYFKNGQNLSILIENGRLDVAIEIKTNLLNCRSFTQRESQSRCDSFVLPPSPIIPHFLALYLVRCCCGKVLKIFNLGFSHTTSPDSIESHKTIKQKVSDEKGIISEKKFETETKMFVSTDRHLRGFMCALVLFLASTSGDYGMCTRLCQFFSSSFSRVNGFYNLIYCRTTILK